MSATKNVHIDDVALAKLSKLVGATVFFSSTEAAISPYGFSIADLYVFPVGASEHCLRLQWEYDYIEEPYTPFSRFLLATEKKSEESESVGIWLARPSQDEQDYAHAESIKKPGMCTLTTGYRNKVAQIHIFEFASHYETSETDKRESINNVLYDGALLIELAAPYSLYLRAVESEIAVNNLAAATFLRTHQLYEFMSERRVRLSLGEPQERFKLPHA
ncbi:hypothetical protein [Hyphococcus luteus]|uniref:Uncharacterized protein n=1 Tax=Hyphococcus luteus TaxID=2058213 RepID=A0A2S7K680_9PROT|nr:hypothetical protein [Marinicaulis flavus]PQA88024.1 hypothetical protein CW354_06740 [Marinicaulis flavus]